MGAFPKLLGKLRPLSLPVAAAPPGGASANPVGLSIPNQEQDNWCWCAVGLGIGDYYHGPSMAQCVFASAVLGKGANGCCGTISGGPCDKPWYLDRALTTARCFERVDDVSTSPTGFADVQSEIDHGQPLGVRIQWQSVGAHFIAISGYRTSTTGEQLITVEDPYGPVTSTLPIGDLHGSYGSDGGDWTHSYFTARNPMGGGARPIDDPALLGG